MGRWRKLNEKETIQKKKFSFFFRNNWKLISYWVSQSVNLFCIMISLFILCEGNGAGSGANDDDDDDCRHLHHCVVVVCCPSTSTEHHHRRLRSSPTTSLLLEKLLLFLTTDQNIELSIMRTAFLFVFFFFCFPLPGY